MSRRGRARADMNVFVPFCHLPLHVSFELVVRVNGRLGRAVRSLFASRSRHAGQQQRQLSRHKSRVAHTRTCPQRLVSVPDEDLRPSSEARSFAAAVVAGERRRGGRPAPGVSTASRTSRTGLAANRTTAIAILVAVIHFSVASAKCVSVAVAVARVERLVGTTADCLAQLTVGVVATRQPARGGRG